MTTYFKELDLQFCSEIQDELLHYALTKSPKISLRKRDWHPVHRAPDWTSAEEVLLENGYTFRQSKEMKRRRIILAKWHHSNWPGKDPKEEIVIDQYNIPKSMETELVNTLHDMTGIPKEEMAPVLQIQDGGYVLHPHFGHARKSSIFCLLKGAPDEITNWYEVTEPFDVFDIYHIPDFNKLEIATSTCMKENVWTLFNHEEWHSVIRENFDGFRVNLGIDFKTLTMNEALEYFK